MRQHPSLEDTRGIRSFAIAEGADDEQRFVRAREQCGIHMRERADVHRQTRRLQLRSGAPGQLFGVATLAGECHQPRLPGADGRGQGQARGAHLALPAAAVQIQHPAGDEEHQHAQAGHHHDDPPRQPEEAARVQREHTDDDLAAGVLAAVRLVGEQGTCGRIELEDVLRAVVRSVVSLHAAAQRTAWFGREAQVDVAASHALQPVQGGLHLAQVQRAAAGARLVLLGRGAAQQCSCALAVPVERPPQPGQGDHQVHQQHPGADHRVQAPQETAAAA